MWDAQRVQIEKRSKELISESFKLANQGDSANPGDAASQMEGIEAENQLPVATTGAVRTWKSWELERCFCNPSEEPFVRVPKMRRPRCRECLKPVGSMTAKDEYQDHDGGNRAVTENAGPARMPQTQMTPSATSDQTPQE